MKTFIDKSRESYNRKADDYNNTPEGRFTERFKQLLLDVISVRTNDSVLDVACGNGTFLSMLSRKCRIDGYGVDISERMIDNARAKCPDMTFEVSGCEQTSFRNEMFDCITVCAAYHHFPEPRAFAKEASRILKHQGLLYIAEVYYPSIVRAIINPFIPLSKAGDVRLYSPKEIARNFEVHGFEQTGFVREGIIQIVVMQKS